MREFQTERFLFIQFLSNNLIFLIARTRITFMNSYLSYLILAAVLRVLPDAGVGGQFSGQGEREEGEVFDALGGV